MSSGRLSQDHGDRKMNHRAWEARCLSKILEKCPCESLLSHLPRDRRVGIAAGYWLLRSPRALLSSFFSLSSVSPRLRGSFPYPLFA